MAGVPPPHTAGLWGGHAIASRYGPRCIENWNAHCVRRYETNRAPAALERRPQAFRQLTTEDAGNMPTCDHRVTAPTLLRRSQISEVKSDQASGAVAFAPVVENTRNDGS